MQLTGHFQLTATSVHNIVALPSGYGMLLLLPLSLLQNSANVAVYIKVRWSCKQAVSCRMGHGGISK